MIVAIIDSGVANLTSVRSAFDRMEVPANLTSNAEEIQKADRVILPGVGAAPAAMGKLEEKNLISVIKNLKQPVMGICLGMQLMFESSEEGGQGSSPVSCLGVIPGAVKKLKNEGLTLPHMGWNNLEALQAEHALLSGLPKEAFTYFVHSYAAPVSEVTIASCSYGQSFTALCGHRNFFGCQFHPERSGETGRVILENFLAMEA